MKTFYTRCLTSFFATSSLVILSSSLDKQIIFLNVIYIYAFLQKIFFNFIINFLIIEINEIISWINGLVPKPSAI